VVRNAADTGPLVGVTQLETSLNHTCARLANGQARCWGYNGYGGLGDGTDESSALPRRVQA